MLGCMRRTRMQMQCTWWHDMRCMTKTKQPEDKNPTTRKYHNLVPEMARVGIQIWHVIYGVLQRWCSRHHFLVGGVILKASTMDSNGVHGCWRILGLCWCRRVSIFFLFFQHQPFCCAFLLWWYSCYSPSDQWIWQALPTLKKSMLDLDWILAYLDVL